MRLDEKVFRLGLTSSRSQALNYIKLGFIKVNNQIILKPSHQVNSTDQIILDKSLIYVSRAALKLESVYQKFNLDFKNKIVLDVGSSTGGFIDFCLKHGARKVIGVEIGSSQLHPSLINHHQVINYEKKDIRDFNSNLRFDYILIDLSFISLKHVINKIYNLANKQTLICVLVKPQFETEQKNLNSFGVVKNNHIRRKIFKKVEENIFSKFLILNKADSLINGKKGNQERFYLIKKI